MLTRLRWDLRRLLEAAILGQFVVRQVLQEAKHQMAGGLQVGGMQVGAGAQRRGWRGWPGRRRLHRPSCNELAAGGGAEGARSAAGQQNRPRPHSLWLPLLLLRRPQVGHVAHLGGALAGVLLVWLLSRIPEADSK